MRTLFLSSFLPTPWVYGGMSLRTRAILDALLEFSEVDFFYMAYYRHEEIERRLDSIQGSNAFVQSERCKLVGWAPHYAQQSRGRYSKVKSAILSLLPANTTRSVQGCGFAVNHGVEQQLQATIARGNYDAIVVRYLNTLFESGVRNGDGAKLPIYLDADDWESHKMESRKHADPSIQRESRLKSGLRSRRLSHLKRVEELATQSCKRVFVASEVDLDGTHGENLTVLPNIPIQPNGDPIAYAGNSDLGSREVLFVSQMDYPPNRDGIRWFLKECWSSILEQISDARLTLVGASSSELAREIAMSPNVRLVGKVDDLSQSYKRCAFTIAPIQWGGGTSIKVLESIAYGRVSVASDFVAQRMGSRLQDYGCLAAENSEDFIRHCVRLLTDADFRRRLEARCAGLQRSEYSIPAFRKRLRESIMDR